MTSDLNNKDDKSDFTLNLPFWIKNFLIKSFIVSFSIIIIINYMVPDLPKIPETERNKLILLSFIQNPYVLLRLSEIEEDAGNIKNASYYMEAAIGLMEMNGAPDSHLKKYRDRLGKINSK